LHEVFEIHYNIANISIFTFVWIATNSISVWTIEGMCWISYKVANTIRGEMVGSSSVFVSLLEGTKGVFIRIDSERTLVHIRLIGSKKSD